MRYFPLTGHPSTLEMIQLAAQEEHLIGRLNIDLRVPERSNIAGGIKWKYVRLPSSVLKIDVLSIGDLYEFFHGLKWLMDHKTTWRRHVER